MGFAEIGNALTCFCRPETVKNDVVLDVKLTVRQSYSPQGTFEYVPYMVSHKSELWVNMLHFYMTELRYQTNFLITQFHASEIMLEPFHVNNVGIESQEISFMQFSSAQIEALTFLAQTLWFDNFYLRKH